MIREIPRMWDQSDYTFEGEHFSVPDAAQHPAQAVGKGHPPIWVACGNPATFAKAGSMGIGAIAFNFEPAPLKGRIDAYKEAAENPTEIVGQYQNNNVMMTNAVICLEDRERAREIALTDGRGYLVSMVHLYHDTMPNFPHLPKWPERPQPIPDEETLDLLIDGGLTAVRQPGGGRRADREVRSTSAATSSSSASRRGPRARGDPRVPRAVRRQGHPRVRHRPGALHDPLPPDGAAQVPRVRPPGARRQRRGHPHHRPQAPRLTA